MADNSTQTGSDTIRTEDRSGTKTQVVMIDTASDAESERTGLPPSRVLTATSAGLTTSVTGYVPGDVVGTEMTFANAARYSGGGLTVVSAILVEKADIMGAADLYIFDRASTPAADNAAATWADADVLNLLGVINFGAAQDIGANRQSVAVGGLPFIAVPNATSLFGVLVTRSTHTFFGAVGDIQIKLGVISD